MARRGAALKPIGLSVAALSVLSCAMLVEAAPPPSGDGGLRVDITSPADGSRLPWQTQAGYAVTVSYDGKSTKYGEIPPGNILLRAAFADDADAAAAHPRDDLPQALVDIAQSNCMGCHDFRASSAGPSFAAIGQRYTGNATAVALLAGHINYGSSGAWGAGSMPPHPDLSAGQAAAMAQWIVDHGNDSIVHYYVGNEGSFRMEAPRTPGSHAGLVLTAFYTGQLKAGDMRDAAGRNAVVVHGTKP